MSHHEIVYNASPVEVEWHNRTSDNCGLIRAQAKYPAVARWLRAAYDAMFVEGALPRADNEVFSQLQDGRGCSMPIEPLSGALRHPCSDGICGHPVKCNHSKQTSLMNISYIVLANGCGQSRGCGSLQRGRRLLYDLGCALPGPIRGQWTRFVQKFGTRKQSNGESLDDFGLQQYLERIRKSERVSPIGASIPLFRSMYQRQCIEFDHIYAWEANVYEPGVWHATLNFSVPEADRQKISFFNEPVTETNALDMLLRTARPNDFVAFKLDIDSPKLENALVDQILNTPALHSRIDELFWEYHGHVDDHVTLPVAQGNVSHGLEKMSALRRLGIRSHLWV